jgi:ComF family protein
MIWWLERGRARYRSRGAVRDLVHRFKYERNFWARRILAGWLEEGYWEYYGGEVWDALVPVPLHSARLRWREFNQADQLARLLGRRVGVPVWPCLERTRSTEVQSRLHRSERLKNLRGAFGLVKGWDVRDKRVLIIDDVLTTGSTVNACAKVLVEAGAHRVDALCVARG